MAKEYPIVDEDVFLDKGAQGWIWNYSRRHYWRMASWYDFDDLVQDGYMHFYRCKERYSHIRCRPHFMSLFKRTFSNHITECAVKRTRLTEITFAEFDQVIEPHLSAEAPTQSDPLDEFADVIAELPLDLANVVRKLLSDEGLKKMRMPYRRRLDREGRETTNEKFCRIIGQDPSIVDIVGQLRKVLSSGYSAEASV